jgi:hypothetical protein
VNRLVATDTQNGSTQDLTRIRIYYNLHESTGLSLFDSSRHFGHPALPYERAAAGPEHFVFSEADPPERWVDIQAVGWDALANPALVVVEQIGRGDLEIVECCMCKRAPPIAIAQSPNARDVGAQLIVNDDVPTLI